MAPLNTEAELKERDGIIRLQLYSRYQKLDDVWKRAEESLGKYQLPKAVELTCFRDNPRNDCDAEIQLRVTRSKGGADISVRRMPAVQGKPKAAGEMTWHITDAPVVYRVKLVEFLPALREAVVKSAEAFAPKVDEAIHTLNSSLNN